MNRYTYSSSKAHSLPDKAALSARMKIYNAMASEFPINELSSIIDVGVTADKENEASNFFEKRYPHPNRITALSDQDASWMTETGVRFVRGNALNMPFEDNSFDLAFSSAVIEHVGNRENQRQFIRECMRVSKKYVFITTPNRFYPIELHTALPFLHWLPSSVYRKILTNIGKGFFALENNLNLLSENDLTAIMGNIGHPGYKISHIRFFGLKSNLLLIITK